jgi:hypothetical protein
LADEESGLVVRLPRNQKNKELAVLPARGEADSLTALFSGGHEEPERKVSPPATQAKPKAEPKPVVSAFHFAEKLVYMRF